MSLCKMEEDNIKELKEKIKMMEVAYKEELERKDKIISELREQNAVIMKSALKQSVKIDEMQKRLEKVSEK